ncbi:MAG TPA: hypothetical protein VJY54_05255 [Lachnospiraceae bacterium]|nr:hypothetical protein [Lachnospiraceae bacterium]
MICSLNESITIDGHIEIEERLELELEERIEMACWFNFCGEEENICHSFD